MHISEMKSLYEKNNIPQEELNFALNFLSLVEEKLHLNQEFSKLESIDAKTLDEIIAWLVEDQINTVNRFVILMRYFKVSKRNDLFIHMTQYTGSLGVMKSILDKLKKITNQETYESIKACIEIPKLGTPLKDMPIHTKHMMEVFHHYLTTEEIKHVLSDNHHQIPKEAFIKEAIYYEEADSIDDYLIDLHKRSIEELKTFCKEKRVWYEQNITEEVISFVASNQEILSAVRKDQTLYVTKIPYDTEAFLNAQTDYEKRYHVCHCPFVKSMLLDKEMDVPPLWCYCSGGFTKYPFDVLFNKALKVELLESPLKGDLLCRFAISLEGVTFKL